MGLDKGGARLGMLGIMTPGEKGVKYSDVGPTRGEAIDFLGTIFKALKADIYFDPRIDPALD